MNLSTTTLKFLKKAGWYEGRSIDISKFIAFLKKCNNPIHNTVITFLQEFGKLYINYPTPKYKPIGFWEKIFPPVIPKETLCINPTYADSVHYIDGDGLDGYSEFVHKKLCTIGTARNNDVLLVMDDEGKIYAGDSGAVYYAGKNEEVFETFCGEGKLLFMGHAK